MLSSETLCQACCCGPEDVGFLVRNLDFWIVIRIGSGLQDK